MRETVGIVWWGLQAAAGGEFRQVEGRETEIRGVGAGHMDGGVLVGVGEDQNGGCVAAVEGALAEQVLGGALDFVATGLPVAGSGRAEARNEAAETQQAMLETRNAQPCGAGVDQQGPGWRGSFLALH